MEDFELAILFFVGAFVWFLNSFCTLVYMAVSIDRDRPQRIS
nr:hypothetical protein MarFTME_267 [Marseillevirus futianmevirus]